MLETMSDFFAARLDGYDWHMRNEIESAREFYAFTAEQLPDCEGCRVLDLGCGTGLELEAYFARNPQANVTGIDLCKPMLDALLQKMPDKALTLIHGSYFDTPLGESLFDAAVSVESLHHFTKQEKAALYTKLHTSLKQNGYFILTDYFALTDEQERTHREQLLALKAAQGITDDAFYHYDTPLTVQHETEALLDAGFCSVQVLRQWGATFTLKAQKSSRAQRAHVGGLL